MRISLFSDRQFIVRWPGVARRPLTFFASSKKVSKERRPRRLAPAGFPFARRKKWEMSETRLRLRQRTFLIHFLQHANGCVSSGSNRKFKNKFDTRATSYCPLNSG